MTTTTASETKWVGRPIRRREDPRLLVGEGKYIADYTLPGTTYLHVVRSVHAHARIRHIDISKAENYPGVVAVVTGAEVAAAMKPMLVPSIIPNLGGELQLPTVYPLAIDKVLWVGDPVVAVIAESKYIAEDAAQLVEIEYEPLPALINPEEALKPEAPKIYEDWKNNVLWHGVLANGDVDKAFEEADFILSERFYGHRTGAAPMETRGALATYDGFEGLTVHVNSQRPHILRMAISQIMNIPHHKVRVIAPKDVGGAFGTKAPVYREELLISYLALKLKRPVKWVENRMESLMTIGHERDQIHNLELAVRKDGKILGLRNRMIADVGDGRIGVYLGFVMSWLGAAYLTNAYDVPSVHIDLSCVVTNKPSSTPSRAFGEFPGRFAMDYAMHLVARELKLDPRQVFETNIIKQFPHVTATGITHDSGDYEGAFQKLLEHLDYDRVKEEQKEARKNGRLIGVGFAMGCEMSGLGSQIFVPMENQPGYGAATIKIDAHGMVQVFEGDSPQGQGHETTIAQAVADELGITIDDVYISYGDTFGTPFASGTLGNRGASYTVSAAVLACRKLKPKIQKIAAHILGVDAGPEDFTFANGEVIWNKEPSKRIKLRDIADVAILGPTKLPAGMEAGLEATAYFEADIAGMLSIGVHGAVVEVNPETGDYKILRYVVVDDCGVPINPMIVRGQVHGGVVLGIGNTRYEKYYFDETGQPLSTTLMEYHMPSAADVPDIEMIEYNVPTPYTPLGTKGKGEGIPGPVPATLASAITDAIDRPGFKLLNLPLTAESIWRTLNQK
ncbi:xanthine dehydrogenase family protein molybdopterin-binding subunit [Paenibacillus naphthalenovorans]|uniref:xanthine dehydrogenase family protein molybdopterin-binding subunit n=1 Tax=Paenibacillus naphthalenovorans TaxID=162209 RepID=UPI00088B5ACE|nr:xanthine dehydrogenase family protein molybdopterin-binding subunit [Paenibacillus naphthalenovorans]SDI93062.1 carbon-monoxide dehydrogenase large subunit [Paenibacillus naphthalenovorans]